jgi:hypothetical protein
VLSVLSELKERALSHRDRHRDEIAKLEARIASFGGSEEELPELKGQLTELYGPIDDMFKELKLRIESVLTAEQRGGVKTPVPASDTKQPPPAPKAKNGE